jgi:hypothetical protein
VKVSLAGKRVRCPHCHGVFVVPSAAAPAAMIPASAPARRGLATKWRVLSGLALLGLTIAVGLVYVLHEPPQPPLVNVVIGRAYHASVEEAGFHGTIFDKKGNPVRWTDGEGRLTIPIDPQNPPQALRLELWPWRPAQAPAPLVRVSVNQHELFHDHFRDVREVTLDLAGIELGKAVEVRISSDTFIPKQYDPPAAASPHGVRIHAVELLATPR